ncbi:MULTISPECIES: c-type cytochrome [unclassified Roseobacter]|uniref:c-type cytochrome n=2 Tax=unclassified Roseobacter TaxID=196798 RepID=UPI001490F3BB|nr:MULTISPECIES: c-type cytochrome [unclassified Roseobacter]NNV66102.1 c-type cytochrome [Roseobacter sp. HKCCD8434]NNV83118.1 c-type cytochrome [Roseobacter sp. HKCCD6547]NNW04419.1 c-type cytochrome [Roseobacter sp. HKCCD9022]NNX06672.1 c-type cytochrome [Roseobacter sp. HKCCD5919]NNX19467.1 c-type cytochrome [Roseobacter sp. HKCCD8979]NNX87655.1 c-type cytochrome [Roseobacter sp. HKCCD8809]NNY55804.1 c-type cytochrome [Roseobacter sp. HKCCD8199]NNY68582.1 c-type cytochrome [Roseobacter 
MIEAESPAKLPSVKGILWTVCVVVVALPPAGKAQDAELMASGAALYQQNCALCHGENGAGLPPSFPALSGNAALADLSRIVGNIHQGQGDMPPFPDLRSEEIAALATYIRNSWGNTEGEATIEDVSALLENLDATEDRWTIWDGVFSSAQAARGRLVYDGQCAVCHGRRLNGAAEDPDMQSGPPLARANFLREWDGRSLAVLFDYTRVSMPQANPGSLSDEQYADILAYMLSVSGASAGVVELPGDHGELARIVVAPNE